MYKNLQNVLNFNVYKIDFRVQIKKRMNANVFFQLHLSTKIRTKISKIDVVFLKIHFEIVYIEFFHRKKFLFQNCERSIWWFIFQLNFSLILCAQQKYK